MIPVIKEPLLRGNKLKAFSAGPLYAIVEERVF
jgi:hypothetical protein